MSKKSHAYLRIWSLSIICICLTPSLFSQRKTIDLDSLMDHGKELLNQSRHSESIAVYGQASSLAKSSENWASYAESETNIILNLWRQFKLDESLRRAQNLKPDLISRFGIESHEVASLDHQIATVYMYQGKLDEAVGIYEKFISIRKEHGEKGWAGISSAYINLGYVASSRGDFEAMFKYYTGAYEIDKKLYGERHHFIAEDLINLSAIYIHREQAFKARDLMLEAMSILEELGLKGNVV